MTQQSDIERLKTELRAARVDPDGVTIPAVFSPDEARALLAHLERLERDNRVLKRDYDGTHSPGMQDACAAIRAQRKSSPPATPPVDAADTKEGEHG